jgi:hypothetical protein
MKKIELTERRYNNLTKAYDWIEFDKDGIWLRCSGRYEDRPAFNIPGSYRGFKVAYQQRSPSGMGEAFLHLFLFNNIFYFKGASFYRNQEVKESVDAFIDYVREYENCINVRTLMGIHSNKKYKIFPHIIINTNKLIEQRKRGIHVA